ncbi:MAG: 3-oxoacyl-[acyl-carrier-protein] synthase III C-terminal domain-containing protein [Candidatus Eisenbacteria bacterium]
MTRTSTTSAVPRLEAIATALPEHRYRQDEIKRFGEALFIPGLASEDHRLLAVFESAGIERRHFCMPLEWYAEPHGFAEMTARYLEHATALAERVAREVLEATGLAPQDIDQLIFVSTTGLATPSVEARLMNRVPFRADVRRVPLWGLGCAGGAAGLALARTLALGAPESRVLVIALELCSLTFQCGDLDRRNVVATSLFADGAAAAIVCGPHAASAPRMARPAIELMGARSTLWPDTLDVMGWNVDGQGLHVVFSRDIPTIVRDRVRPNLDAFLDAHGLGLDQLDHLIAHPGGPRVLAAYAEALGWDPARLTRAREVLRDCGNMSSPTCLFVLDRAWRAGDLEPGQHAVLTALGPGFASELVLLRASDA